MFMNSVLVAFRAGHDGSFVIALESSLFDSSWVSGA